MKARYFVGLGIFLLGVTVLGLRYNNITAYNMKVQLEARAGGQELHAKLKELEQFVHSHMNASMEIFLFGSYQHDLEVAQARVQEENSGVYDEAARACDREGQLTRANAECVKSYLERHLTNGQNIAEVPEENDYRYRITSPAWTTDIPGLSLLGSVISLLAAAIIYARNWLRT